MNLQTKLDKIFSEYIRLRDSYANGYGRCISCGKIVHWKEADAGHFVCRKHLSLRYDEHNVNLQCRACNRFDEGNKIGYHRRLVEKYGEGVIDLLVIRRNTFTSYSKGDYELMIRHFSGKIKELKKQNN